MVISRSCQLDFVLLLLPLTAALTRHLELGTLGGREEELPEIEAQTPDCQLRKQALVLPGPLPGASAPALRPTCMSDRSPEAPLHVEALAEALEHLHLASGSLALRPAGHLSRLSH